MQFGPVASLHFETFLAAGIETDDKNDKKQPH